MQSSSKSWSPDGRSRAKNPACSPRVVYYASVYAYVRDLVVVLAFTCPVPCCWRLLTCREFGSVSVVRVSSDRPDRVEIKRMPQSLSLVIYLYTLYHPYNTYILPSATSDQHAVNHGDDNSDLLRISSFILTTSSDRECSSRNPQWSVCRLDTSV